MTLRPYLLACCLLATAPAFAQDGAALVQSKNCAMCHASTPNGMAPTFASIAKKYAGDASAARKLAAVIKNGGHGGSSPVSMPPYSVSEADALAMAKYVLAAR